jgi:cytochrome c-type biogenesis protein CcmH/NrfG
VPGWLLAIPALWAIVGAPAALSWGVWQDVAMPAGAIVAVAMIVARTRRQPLSPAEAAEREDLAALAGVG